jgi:hypothetical protein
VIVRPMPVAEIYALRHQTDAAFEWLDRAYANRDDGLIATKVDPLLKSLHHDPRFARALEKAQPVLHLAAVGSVWWPLNAVLQSIELTAAAEELRPRWRVFPRAPFRTPARLTHVDRS